MFYPSLNGLEDIKAIVIPIHDNDFHWVFAIFIPPKFNDNNQLVLPASCYASCSVDKLSNALFEEIERFVPKLVLLMRAPRSWYTDINIFELRGGPRQNGTLDCFLFALVGGVYMALQVCHLQNTLDVSTPIDLGLVNGEIRGATWNQKQITQLRSQFSFCLMWGPKAWPPEFMGKFLDREFSGFSKGKCPFPLSLFHFFFYDS